MGTLKVRVSKQLKGGRGCAVLREKPKKTGENDRPDRDKKEWVTGVGINLRESYR